MPPKKSNPSSKSVALKAYKLMDTAVVHSPSPMLIYHCSMMAMLANTATYARTWSVLPPMSKNADEKLAELQGRNTGSYTEQQKSGFVKWRFIKMGSNIQTQDKQYNKYCQESRSPKGER